MAEQVDIKNLIKLLDYWGLNKPKTYKEKIFEKYMYDHRWDLPIIKWEKSLKDKGRG